MATYSDIRLDALRELAGSGSASASAALSSLLGRAAAISMPTVAVLPFAEAVAVAGEAEELWHVVTVPIGGDVDATVVVLFGDADARAREVGGILATSYVAALARMAGLRLQPGPAQVVESVPPGGGGVLVLDGTLTVEGEERRLSLLLLGAPGVVVGLLARLGQARAS